MSRIGRKPIAIPAGVTVTVDDANVVTVKGPKGTLSEKIHAGISVKVEGAEVNVTRPNDEKEMRSLHGLSRTLIYNMVVGVTEGYTKNLEVIGVGYRCEMKGKDLLMHLGYSHDVLVAAPAGITFAIPADSNGLKITITGANKQQVGQIAAVVRGKRPPEPYHGKGVRYEGEFVRSKSGKAGK
ncbi:MAG: 50S ribosomal protein L6 [Clostridiales bacterium]|nr:50S ribosomal protein L6 [Candidatus Coliplasma caballi]